MRRVISRGAMVVLCVVVSAGAFAAPAQQSQNRGVRTVKKIIRALGDFITVPTPAPTPAPKEP